MNESLNKLLNRSNREDGFTVVELMGAVIIVLALAAVIMPASLKYQDQLELQGLKADLQSARVLIEQEQIDNNGLFPTYLPNEVKNNPTMKNFAYTYSNDRTQMCLQTDSREGKFYSSSQSNNITQIDCTLPNIAEGSVAP